MKERPILYTSPMVNATFAGIKTNTRRPIKWGRAHMPGIAADMCNETGYLCLSRDTRNLFRAPWNEKSIQMLKCPYGIPGDRLWVRETFMPLTRGFAYRADGLLLEKFARWTPSIFMPRTACRLVLEIVKTEAIILDDITNDQAIREGVLFWWNTLSPLQQTKLYPASQDPRHCFQALWKSIYGNDSWKLKTWVWNVEFKIFSLERV
jgi:hypothetical protein